MSLPEFHLDPGAPDERLERWLDGDLPAAESARVAEAVERFEAWAQAADAAHQVQAALRSAPAPIAPPDFTMRVMREVARREQASRVPVAERLRSWLRVPAWQPALALAAVALMVAVLWPRPPQPSPDEVAAALEEVQWTLAYLSRTSEKTGVLVRDRVIAPHVVAPVQQALGEGREE